MPTAKEETKDIFSSSASESRHKMFSVIKFMISNQVRFTQRQVDFTALVQEHNKFGYIFITKQTLKTFTGFFFLLGSISLQINTALSASIQHTFGSTSSICSFILNWPCHMWEQAEKNSIRNSQSIKEEMDLPANFLIRKKQTQQAYCGSSTALSMLNILTFTELRPTSLKLFTTGKFATVDKVI